jgi:hypothetical protein
MTMIKPEDELGIFISVEHSLEEGYTHKYEVLFSTPFGQELVAEPPSLKCAQALADALNLVRERILDCGSDQEVFRLMQELYEWRIMK